MRPLKLRSKVLAAIAPRLSLDNRATGRFAPTAGKPRLLQVLSSNHACDKGFIGRFVSLFRVCAVAGPVTVVETLSFGNFRFVLKNFRPRLEGTVGLLRTFQGKSAEADELYRRALAIDEKVFGPEHKEVATDLNNLAGAVMAQVMSSLFLSTRLCHSVQALKGVECCLTMKRTSTCFFSQCTWFEIC